MLHPGIVCVGRLVLGVGVGGISFGTISIDNGRGEPDGTDGRLASLVADVCGGAGARTGAAHLGQSETARRQVQADVGTDVGTDGGVAEAGG